MWVMNDEKTVRLPKPKLSLEERRRITTGAKNRLSVGIGSLALCAHCRNAMEFDGETELCRSCRQINRKHTDTDEQFRAETRNQLKILGWILFFGLLIICLLSWLARKQF